MSNKDEALRAREEAEELMRKAEELMRKADFTAARRFAVKAQKLDTSPENVVSGMIMVCDVHCAALEKSGDETDWYKILQVEQNANDNAIKKQFRKLARMIHPDKNRFSGAGSAFNFIKEAVDILLDTDKRRRHDRKRKAPTKEGSVESISDSESYESISDSESYESISDSESYECEVVSISSEDEQETPVDDNSYGEDEEISQSIPFDDEEAESDVAGSSNVELETNPQFLTTIKVSKELYIPTKVVKDNHLRFGDSVIYIDEEGTFEGLRGNRSNGKLVFRGWNSICRRNRLKLHDTVKCVLLHDQKRVHSIRVQVMHRAA